MRNEESTLDGEGMTRADEVTSLKRELGAALLREQSVKYELHQRDHVLAVVSHDLRNPLSAIAMAAQIITNAAPESADGARIKKTVATIVRAADRMAKLLDDLLEMPRIEHGEALSVNLALQDAVAPLREAADLLGPLAESRRLKYIATEFPPPTLMNCDAKRLGQALSNIIGNAIKFTKEGGVITVAARRTATELAVTVHDTGIGIAGENLPHLFTPYWRADPAKAHGIGLGLSIAKAAVEAHGGRISVETIPGQGSTFAFALPLPKPDAAETSESVG